MSRRIQLLTLAFICACAAGTNVTSKACYAYFGYVSDLGFTYSQNLARAWVDAELGTQSRYVEGVGLSATDAQLVTMNDFIQDGCNIIIVGSDAMQDLLLSYADVHPSIKFICLTCCCFDPRSNVASIEINNYEAAYISGIVAAMQGGVDTIAYVGSTYVPPSFRNLNAFALGVFTVQPNITLLVTHVGSWFDPRTERIVSKRLILQHGVDLLAYDSDSTTVVEVAGELGKLSIAAKVDGTAVHGESNLMSRIRLWNAPLLGTMSAAVGVMNWTLHKDDNAAVGFAEDAVSLGTFSSRVSVAARIRAEQLSQMFAAGVDPTWCLLDGQLGFVAFCPVAANNPSGDLGGVSPSSLFPCNLSGGKVYPDAGSCLSWTQQRNMAWMINGYIDLGLASFPTECVAGTRMDFTGTELCVACSPGSISLGVDAEECQSCVQGRFSVDGLECLRCPAGTYSDSIGRSACEDCSAGSFASSNGQTECASCPEGYFTSTVGQQTCARCPVGAYANESGSSSCSLCAEGKTTQYYAASASRECICPEGSYQDDIGGCVPCPVGMVCREGSDVSNLPSRRSPNGQCEGASCAHPQTLPGYMSLPDAPLRVYKCLTEAACPGGLQGIVSRCGAFRANNEVACGLCSSGSFENGEKDCEACEGDTDTLLLMSVIVLAVAAVVTTSYAVNRDLLMQGHGMLNVIIVGGVLLTAIQTTIVFSQLELHWADPLHGVVSFATRTFSFNIRVLRLACQVAVSPVSSFAASQLVTPSCVPILAVTLLVKKYVFKGTKSMSADLVNSTGSICSVFFIAVSTTSIQPLVCYPHPSENGARSSMLSEPAVLCWADDERHAALVAIAAISFLLVPASFFSASVFALWVRARIMVSGSRRRWWLHAFRFLFFRFKPGKHIYGVVLLLRNLTICLIPAVIPGDLRALQVVLLLLVLQVSAAYQNTLYPFCTLLANLVDSCINIVLILILVLGMLKTGIQVDERDLIVLSTLVLGMGVLAVVGGVCVGLRAVCFRTFRFYYFLSHHKADAAAQARYMQMLIRMHLRRSCFLDSDNLVDLAVLFDIVKSSVSHFVILLTRDTLRRPWCVGELIIALEAKLPLARILHPSFQKPTESDLDDVTNYVPQQRSLANFHIDSQRIAPALRAISSDVSMRASSSLSKAPMSTIAMESTSCIGTSVFQNVVQELGNTLQNKMNPSLPRFQEDAVVISYDSEDYEAAAAGGILMSTFQEKGSTRLIAGVISLPDLDAHMSKSLRQLRRVRPVNVAEHSSMRSGSEGLSSTHRCVLTSRAVVVVLSIHSLQSRDQLNTIEIAVEEAKPCIPVCTPQFRFPTELYITMHLPALIDGDENHSTVVAVKRFFSQIAVAMTTQASQTVLQAEQEQVIARVPLKKQAERGGRDRSSSRQVASDCLFGSLSHDVRDDASKDVTPYPSNTFGGDQLLKHYADGGEETDGQSHDEDMFRENSLWSA